MKQKLTIELYHETFIRKNLTEDDNIRELKNFRSLQHNQLPKLMEKRKPDKKTVSIVYCNLTGREFLTTGKCKNTVEYFSVESHR